MPKFARFIFFSAFDFTSALILEVHTGKNCFKNQWLTVSHSEDSAAVEASGSRVRVTSLMSVNLL